MLRYILVALVLLIVGIGAFIALQRSEVRVERTATIAAAPAEVFARVNDLHKWDTWSPWAKLDPNAKVAYEGASSGKGAVYTWSGNERVGEGRMEIIESKPSELVDIKVDFVRPYENTQSSMFVLKPVGEGTSVTWTVSGHKNFSNKAVCLLISCKKMMGDDLERGLAQLKAVAEKKLN
jgi:hypothetical protein